MMWLTCLCLCLRPLKVSPSVWRQPPLPLPPPRICSSPPVTRWPSSAPSLLTTYPFWPWKWPGWQTAAISSPWSAAGWSSRTCPRTEHKENGGRQAWSEREQENTGWALGGWVLTMEGCTPAVSEPSLRQEGAREEEGSGTWRPRKPPVLWRFKCPRSVSETACVCFALCFILKMFIWLRRYNKMNCRNQNQDFFFSPQNFWLLQLIFSCLFESCSHCFMLRVFSFQPPEGISFPAENRLIKLSVKTENSPSLSVHSILQYSACRIKIACSKSTLLLGAPHCLTQFWFRGVRCDETKYRGILMDCHICSWFENMYRNHIFSV